MKCPCCDSEIDEVPVAALAEIRMPPGQMKVMWELLRAYPKYVTMDSLIHALYSDDPDGGPLTPRNIMSVMMCRIREQLAPLGWTVSINGKGRGYPGKYRIERMRSGRR